MPVTTNKFPAVVDCGNIPHGAPMSERVIVRSAPSVLVKNRTVFLVRATRGYEIAGSCLRWTNSYWSVEERIDGTRYAERYGTEYFKARAEYASRTGTRPPGETITEVTA